MNSANSNVTPCTVVMQTLFFCAALLWSISETPAPDPPIADQNDPNSSIALEPTFKLLLTLTYPLKCVQTTNRKTKNIKPESENKGPYDVSINIGWEAFLGVIANKLMIVPSSLVTMSFTWHWLKPASGPWLPV